MAFAASNISHSKSFGQRKIKCLSNKKKKEQVKYSSIAWVEERKNLETCGIIKILAS